LINVSRQALYAFQAGEPDDLSIASAALSEVTLALQRVSSSTIEVSFAVMYQAEQQPALARELSAAPNRSNATLLAFVTITTILTCPDVEQISSASPVLQALARLTEVANAEEAAGDEASPAGRAVTVRISLIEELIQLPPAAGQSDGGLPLRG
jgi:hypothetical protein